MNYPKWIFVICLWGVHCAQAPNEHTLYDAPLNALAVIQEAYPAAGSDPLPICPALCPAIPQAVLLIEHIVGPKTIPGALPNIDFFGDLEQSDAGTDSALDSQAIGIVGPDFICGDLTCMSSMGMPSSRRHRRPKVQPAPTSKVEPKADGVGPCFNVLVNGFWNMGDTISVFILHLTLWFAMLVGLHQLRIRLDERNQVLVGAVAQIAPARPVNVLRAADIDHHGVAEVAPARPVSVLRAAEIEHPVVTEIAPAEIAPARPVNVLRAADIDHPMVAPKQTVNVLRATDIDHHMVADIAPTLPVNVLRAADIDHHGVAEVAPARPVNVLRAADIDHHMVADIAPALPVNVLRAADIDHPLVAPKQTVNVLRATDIDHPVVPDLAPARPVNVLRAADIDHPVESKVAPAEIAPTRPVNVLRTADIDHIVVPDLAPVRSVNVLIREDIDHPAEYPKIDTPDVRAVLYAGRKTKDTVPGHKNVVQYPLGSHSRGAAHSMHERLRTMHIFRKLTITSLGISVASTDPFSHNRYGEGTGVDEPFLFGSLSIDHPASPVKTAAVQSNMHHHQVFSVFGTSVDP